MNGGGTAFDWQFAAVTLAALWGAWALLRPLLRWRAAKRAAACPHCAAGDACAAQPASAPAGSQPLVQIGAGRVRPAPSGPSAQSGARR